MSATDEPLESISDFRRRVRAFFAELPALLGERRGTMDRAKAYRRALFDAGFAGISYPIELGGAGLPTEYDLAFRDESRELVPGEDACSESGSG
jgi:alkylation response protein AidB-like acyl-CoA dehydrogenase